MVGALFGSSKASALERICLSLLINGLAVTVLVKAQRCYEPSWVPNQKIENLRVGFETRGAADHPGGRPSAIDAQEKTILFPAEAHPAPKKRQTIRDVGVSVRELFQIQVGIISIYNSRADTTMRKSKRVSGLMVGAIVAAALSACAVAAYAQESKQKSPGVTGVWTGKSSARCAMTSDRTRCGAVNDITFTMVQRGSKVTGSYRCAFGNMNCRNMNNTGEISDGTMEKLLTLRVIMPDGSSCRFSGQPSGDSIKGGNSCKGGPRAEQGSWDARRSR